MVTKGVRSVQGILLLVGLIVSGSVLGYFAGTMGTKGNENNRSSNETTVAPASPTMKRAFTIMVLSVISFAAGLSLFMIFNFSIGAINDPSGTVVSMGFFLSPILTVLVGTVVALLNQ